MYIVICVLITFCLVFIYKYFSLKKYLQSMYFIVDEIVEGNFNRRFHSLRLTKSTKDLNSKLNDLMDKFETIIEKKQYLEESRKKMISDISHDLRTPLTSLLGYMQILKKDKDLNEDERKKYQDIIDAKGDTLLCLIQDFFEMAKLDSDDGLLICKKIDITEMLENILAGFYELMSDNNVTVDIMLPGTHLFVWGDSYSIDRILHNLISNAIYHGCEGGVIGIGLRNDNDKVWVDVWDKGKGIPEKNLKFIFDRSFTTEPSGNKKHKGSGLGLSITKKLIEKQKGEIFVSSTPGVKTTLSFYLQKYDYAAKSHIQVRE